MRVLLNLELCQGYANCVDAAPEIFDLDDNAMAVLLNPNPGPEQEAAARQAERMCPAQAITVEDD